MSTRSYICIENPDHTLTGIYCHWDGYIEHNDVLLQEFYTDRKRVEDLIALGDLSFLNERIAPEKDEQHSWENPADYVTVAYCRDRGEEWEDVKPKKVDLSRLQEDICIEFIYVFGLDDKWRVYDDPEGSRWNKYNGDLLETVVKGIQED